MLPLASGRYGSYTPDDHVRCLIDDAGRDIATLLDAVCGYARIHWYDKHLWGITRPGGASFTDTTVPLCSRQRRSMAASPSAAGRRRSTVCKGPRFARDAAGVRRSQCSAVRSAIPDPESAQRNADVKVTQCIDGADRNAWMLVRAVVLLPQDPMRSPECRNGSRLYWFVTVAGAPVDPVSLLVAATRLAAAGVVGSAEPMVSVPLYEIDSPARVCASPLT